MPIASDGSPIGLCQKKVDGVTDWVANARTFGLEANVRASHRDADTDVLALAAGQSERNQGQSARIAAYLAPICQFLPGRKQISGSV
ncbi:MAG: hypothetical protein QOF06_1648 [Solirubrobacterales bacterium]|jgi:hypothetical protein|nr:hypothetical protein [Solirubrobacterales bacterium]